MIDQDSARKLEGRRVGVALCDGTRIDDAPLVSAGRPNTRTLWLFANGTDVFVACTEVIDIRVVDGWATAA